MTIRTGTSLPFTLFVIFVIFKLTGVIGWSWWWVTSPLWLPFATIGIVLGVGFVLVSLVSLLNNWSRK